MKLPLPLVILALALMASVAAASEASKRLYSRGLLDFNSGRFAPALARFEEAVHADPQDYYALYYRGVTRGRTGDLAGAIADLRTVTANQPAIKQALLELGVALVQSGAEAAAVPYLQEAQQVPALAGQASLFLGIAQLRLQQMSAARQNFERAATADPSLRLSATYYEGIADFREGKTARAAEHFSAVVAASRDSIMGHEAAQFLERIRRGEGASYQLYGLVGFQYDSNVVLAPSDAASNEVVKQVLAISNQGDGRATIEAGGTYIPWHSERAQLSVGYDFYQSLHFRLTDFNLQDHRPSVQLVGRVGPAEIGLLGRYDYYFLDTDSFLQEGSAVPWVTIPEGNVGRTEAFYRERRRDFFKRAFDSRDAFNHSPGIRQVIYLGAPDDYVFAGYRFDREDPVHNDDLSNSFAYDGHQLEAGIDWLFPIQLSAELSYAFRHEEYDSPSKREFDPLGRLRRDDDHQVVLALRQQLADHVAVVAAYLGTFDNSTKPLFQYQRHVGSLALEVRL